MSSRDHIAKIRAEIESLRRQDGGIAPEDVVEFAENPNTALHARFEWDDTEAARKYRLNQAMHLIVIYTSPANEPKRNTGSISVPILRGKGEGSYLKPDHIAEKEEYRLSVLEEIKAKLRSLRDSHGALLPELKSVWRAIGRECDTKPSKTTPKMKAA